ncbi:MAG: murein L,D-transpeptidase [Hyphomicrobiaceae bacterium]
MLRQRHAAPAVMAAALAFVSLTAVPSTRAVEPEPPSALITAEEAIGIAVRQRLATAEPGETAGDKSDREALAAFYVARGSEPLWIDASGLTPKARALADEIARAADWGLDPKAFALPESDLGASPSRDVLAAAEARLSIAALRYARFARGGRIPDPRDMSSYLDRDPQLVSPVLVLERLAETSDPGGYIVSLHPQHEGFQRLRRKLIEMRTAAAETKAEQPVAVPAEGPTLIPGNRHPDVALLRQRLKVEQSAGGDAQLYDDALIEAVKAYQGANGMTPDGLVGRRTRASLNGGAPDRRRADEGLLIANMEMWRWMPDDLGATHVMVNLPEYQFRVVKNGGVIHEERLIIGKVENQTPVFSHAMEFVVLHPFWGVPDSIKVREVLPGIARGNNLSRQGLRLQYNGRDVDATQIDWSKADIRQFHVYQPPGPANVLGVVKFMFPNKHQVYMHDTPTKHLFATSTRTYSHGCMRVRNPVRLAEVILQEDKGWSAEQVHQLLRTGPENNNVTLEKNIPVHVVYFTAWVDDSGELQTRPDVYSHERRVRLALDGKWNQIPRHADHLAPVKLERPLMVQNEIGSGGGGNAVENFFQNLFGGF